VPAIRVLFLLVGAIIGVFYPFIPAILDDRGFSPFQVGLTTAASAVAFTVAVATWGHLGDAVVGRAAALRMGVIGSTIAVLALLLDVPPIGVAILIVVFIAFEASFAPLSDALAVNALAGAPRAYARVRLLASLGFALASIGAGWLYDQAGYRPASILWAVAAVALVVTIRAVPDVAARFRDQQAPPDAEAISIRRPRRGGTFGETLRRAPRLRGLLLGLGLVHVGIICGFTFLGLRLLDLGAGASGIALSAGISALAEIPAIFVFPRLAAWIGIRALLVGGIVLYGLVMVSWAFLDDPTLIVASRLASGVAFAGITVGAVMTIARLVPAELQGTGQALYQTVGFGLAAIVANAVGGVVFGAAGPMPLFLGCAVLAGSGAVIAWRSIPPLPSTARMAAWQEG